MAFCSKCGAHIPDDAQFCNNCGTEVKKNNVDFSQFKNTSDYTATIDQADMNSNKAMAIISYLGFLFLIPLFAAKNSRFAVKADFYRAPQLGNRQQLPAAGN